MQDLINEIRKLIEYAGENGKIQKEDSGVRPQYGKYRRSRDGTRLPQHT